MKGTSVLAGNNLIRVTRTACSWDRVGKEANQARTGEPLHLSFISVSSPHT